MKRNIICAVIVLFALATVAKAQLATISGTVSDPSGAVIPSAKATATQVGTGLARSVSANTQGYYVIPSLHPSEYKITVTAPGFRNFTQTGITLLADESATVNVTLQVGKTTQQVTVEAGAQQVNTTTSTLSEVVNQARMVELPLNGRNAANLTLLVAGAVNAPSAGANQGTTKTPPGAVTISTNGSLMNAVTYMMDGGNNNDTFTGINDPFPFPDATQEFSVLTSNYSAKYGGDSGGVVNVVTKSGTNQLHGDGFEFVRNAVFNARNFFEDQRDQLKRNQFGGTIGGPIDIPGLYNGRDRTFFFFGYQGTRIRNIQGGLSAIVPTQANLNGDFSALLDASNPDNPQGKAVQIIDPATGQPFNGNLIPVSSFDPSALKVENYLPKPTGSGLVFYTRAVAQDTNEYVARVDHSISSKDRLSVRAYYNRFSNAPSYESTNILTLAGGSVIGSHNYLLHETHVFRPNLLNEFRFDYVRTAPIRFPPPGSPGPVRDFGVQGIFNPPDPSIDGFSVSGFFSFSTFPVARFVRNNFEWADDMSWVHGQHTMSFGGRIQRSRQDISNINPQNGQFTFTSDVTNYALASFLLGKLRQFVQGQGQFENSRHTQLGLYFEDAYHATHRLTLNYGMRWEPFKPWHEIYGRSKIFEPQDFYKGVTSSVFPNAPAGFLFPGDPGVPRDGTNPDWNNLAPRAGFAYDVFGNGKTSVRGGFGMFYEARLPSFLEQKLASTTPYNPRLFITDPTGPFSNPFLGSTNPFLPPTFPYPTPIPSNIDFPAPVTVYSLDPSGNFQTPTIYNWNLTVEHELVSNWLLRVGFVGSHGSHLREGLDLNPAFYMAGSGLGTDQRRTLFPGYGNIWVGSQDINSSYNSLQVSIQKRLTHGLTILGNYTYSKSIDDMPYPINVSDNALQNPSALPWFSPQRHQFDRGPSDFDHTQRAVVSYVWELPRLENSNSLMRGVLGSWELTGIMSAQSGDRLTVMAGKDQSQTGLGKDRGVVVGPALGQGACGNKAPCVDYLNPSSFILPAAGTFGNVGKGSLTGPGLFNWDMGFFKNIPFRGSERYKLQFRAEFFNIFNRVNFGNPTTTVSSGAFGSIRSAGDPRIGQLALKLFF